MQSIVIHGMAGIGKSYLARKFSFEIAKRNAFTGGVIWLEVGPQMVNEASIQVLLHKLASYAFGGFAPPTETLHPEQVAMWLHELAPGRLFIIFDDVWSQTPLHSLLQALPPEAAYVITTRDAAIAHSIGSTLLTLDRLTPLEGLALLEDRLQCGEDTSYRADLEAIVDILHGHALALDIAVARIQKVSWIPIVLRDLQKGIGQKKLQGLQLARGEDRNESLERSLALSYRQMDEEMKRLFHSLGVFAPEAPITAEAAAEIWGLEGENALQTALFQLRDFANLSLLTEMNEESGTQYYQHRLLHIYAHALLEQSEECTATQWLHAYYYRNVALKATLSSPQEYALLDTHLFNLLEALEWARGNEALLFSQLVEVSAQYLRLRGQLTLLETYLPYAIRIADSSGNILQLAHHLQNVGEVEQKLGNLDQARQYNEKALHLFQKLGIASEKAYTLEHLGRIATRQGEREKAKAYFYEALPLFKSCHDQVGEAYVLEYLGDIERLSGHLDQAYAHFQASLDLFHTELHLLGEAGTLVSLGELERQRRNFDAAHDHYMAALPLFHMERNKLGEAQTLLCLGELERQRHHFDMAQNHCTTALPLFHEERNKQGEANALKSLGNLAFVQGKLDQAYNYYSDALPLFHMMRDKEIEANLFQVVGILGNVLGKTEQAKLHYDIASTFFDTESHPQEKAMLLMLAGELEAQFSNIGQSFHYYEEALPLFQAEADKVGEAFVARGLGKLEGNLGNIKRAYEHYKKALSVFTALDDDKGRATVMADLGELECRQGNIDQARIHYTEALSLCHSYEQARGDAESIYEAEIVYKLGDLENNCGNFEQARVYYDSALALFRSTHNLMGEANVLYGIGDVERQVGSFDVAYKHYQEALSIYQRMHNQQGEANALRGLGDIERFWGESTKAQAFYNRAQLLYRTLGDKQGEARIYRDSADMFLAEREWGKARSYYEQALPLYAAESDPLGQAYTLIDLGRVKFALGDQTQGIADVEKALFLFHMVQNKLWEQRAELYLRILRSTYGTVEERAFLFEETANVINELVQARSQGEKQQAAEKLCLLPNNLASSILTSLVSRVSPEHVEKLDELRNFVTAYGKEE